MSAPQDSGDECNASEPDYKVGYGRPPLASRFKPGNPGNPTGRRKRRKTVGEIIRDTMTRRIEVRENGRPRRVTLQEVIVLNLARAAAQGDGKAIRTLFTLQERYQDSGETVLNPDDLDAEDRKIIAEHFAKLGSVDEAPCPQADPNAKPQGSSDGSSDNKS